MHACTLSTRLEYIHLEGELDIDKAGRRGEGQVARLQNAPSPSPWVILHESPDKVAILERPISF